MAWLRAQRADPDPDLNIMLIHSFYEFELIERAERALNSRLASADALNDLPTEQETFTLAGRIIFAMRDMSDIEDRLTLDDGKDSIAVAFIKAKKNVDIQIRGWKIMVRPIDRSRCFGC